MPKLSKKKSFQDVLKETRAEKKKAYDEQTKGLTEEEQKEIMKSLTNDFKEKVKIKKQMV